MTASTATAGTARGTLQQGRPDIAGTVFAIVMLFSLLFSLGVLAVLIGDQLARGLPVLAERGTDFLTSDLSSNPSRAGLAQGLIGTALLCAIVALVAFPIGIMTAIYLEEYAGDNLLAGFIAVNIRNLAGVPSVVYGLLGLAFFVALFAGLGVGNGKNVLSGGLTLAVLILPLVIITSAEAIRAVPRGAPRVGLRTRGVALAGRPPTRPAIGGAGHPDRHGPGPVPGAWRDGAADPCRRGPRLVLERRQPGRCLRRAVCRLADDRLRLGPKAAGGVPGADVRGHPHPARRDHPRQHGGHHPAQPVRPAMVTEEPPGSVDDRSSTMTTDATPSDGDPMTTISREPDIDVAPHAPPTLPTLGTMTTAASEPSAPPVLRLDDVHFYYGAFRAVKEVTVDIPTHQITALIGPSGCGKSTLLRTMNRMNDLIPGTSLTGRLEYHGENLYASDVDPVEVRRRIGMVFQKPNPFPKSIYDNVAFGPRLTGFKGNLNELVERSLRRAAIWDEVKDKLKQSGLSLSGGQQQRLCIARAIATEPEVILMDEPCSALDPRSTLQIEELMSEIKQNYTIVIVTHNMQQAARASDKTVFLTMAEDRAGYVVEQGDTIDIFTNPKDQLTEDYVSGRFG